MPRKKALIDKKIYKLSVGACKVCGETDPAVLDVHRILEGANGGKYTRENSVCLCCKCHRKVHDGQIVIDRYYQSTSGCWVLHFFDNGVEKFV
jgi:hypothetical protein